MSIDTKVKNFLRHTLNGNWALTLCRTCLLPLDEDCRNIFSKITHKKKKLYVTDVLRTICDLKVPEEDNCNICSSCLQKAIAAYDFIHQIGTTEKILDFCIAKFSDFLNVNIDTDLEEDNRLFFYLSINKNIDPYEPVNKNTNLKKYEKHSEIEITIENDALSAEELENTELMIVPDKDTEIESSINTNTEKVTPAESSYILVMNDDSNQNVYETSDISECIDLSEVDTVRKRKQRQPMTYKYCPRCPTRYRMFLKLKQHMKSVHEVDIFVCKICDVMVEGEEEFQSHTNTHTRTHTDLFICDCCNKIFRIRSKIISHLKQHENSVEMRGDSNICDICGETFTDNNLMKIHHKKFHEVKMTCLYCGKKVKSGSNFEAHLKKHMPGRKMGKNKYSCEFCQETFHLWKEMQTHIGTKHGDERSYECDICKKRYRTIQTLRGHKKTHSSERNYHCEVCGGRYINACALMWHKRLHSDERPYACEICKKGFKTANRRNQHVICSHTAPTLQCPLCASLFHTRAIINAHIKKVHLRAHKRWNRSTRAHNVGWKTEQVPLEELSIDIQNKLKNYTNKINSI